MSELIIGDDNYTQFVDEHNLRTGGMAGVMPRDVPMGGLACATPFSESVSLIPRNEWDDRIKAMNAAQAFPNQRRKALSKALGKSVVKDQDGLNFCHLFALTNCVESNRQSQGLPYIELAPESMGGVVNWSNSGGYMTADIQYATQHGIAPRSFCPPYKHSPGSFQDGWQDAAKLHVPLEWFELGHQDIEAECITALLLGYPVYGGWDWWSHSVMLGALVDANHWEIENSWRPSWGNEGYGILTGGRRLPSTSMGCFALRTTSWSPS
jgi:hypothetical protein